MKGNLFSRREMLGSLTAAVCAPQILKAAQARAAQEVPWLAEVQSPPRPLPADAPRLKPLLVDAAGRPIRDLKGWELRREEIRRAWLDFLKPLPLPRGEPPKLTVLEEDKPEGVVRRLVRYEAEPGLATEAYLLKPSQSARGGRPGAAVFFSNWEAPWYLGPEIQKPTFTREHHELLALVAPRAFLLLGGDSADGDRSWPFVESALGVYRLYGGAPRLGLYNHKQGHSVPPAAEKRLYQWIETYCRRRRG